ncbi:hypothetical protein PybrP1_002418, partial [[Pythium] brassicae (nom. inval.)]
QVGDPRARSGHSEANARQTHSEGGGAGRESARVGHRSVTRRILVPAINIHTTCNEKRHRLQYQRHSTIPIVPTKRFPSAGSQSSPYSTAMAGVQSKKTSSYDGVTSAASDASFAPYAISIDAPLPTASESPPRTGDDEWGINLFDCLCAPAHCCVAVFLPFVSAGYVANGISRFGALVGVSFFLILATGIALALAARAYDPDTGVYVSTIFVGKGDDAVLANSWSIGVTVCALLFLGGVALLRRAARKLPSVSFTVCIPLSAGVLCNQHTRTFGAVPVCVSSAHLGSDRLHRFAIQVFLVQRHAVEVLLVCTLQRLTVDVAVGSGVQRFAIQSLLTFVTVFVIVYWSAIEIL